MLRENCFHHKVASDGSNRVSVVWKKDVHTSSEEPHKEEPRNVHFRLQGEIQVEHIFHWEDLTKRTNVLKFHCTLMCTELTYWKKSTTNVVFVGNWCCMISMILFSLWFFKFSSLFVSLYYLLNVCLDLPSIFSLLFICHILYCFL